LVERAQDWPWSSVACHLLGRDSKLVKVAPVLGRYGDFATFLDQKEDDFNTFKMLRQSETTGRPAGSDSWVEKLEVLTGRK